MSLPQVLDVTDADLAVATYIPQLEGLELVAYRNGSTVLHEHLRENPTLQRIRAGQPVRETELEALARLVLQIDDKANLNHLLDYYPETAGARLLRHPQPRRLDAARSSERSRLRPQAPTSDGTAAPVPRPAPEPHRAERRHRVDRLYEPPFTPLHTESLDGVFHDPADRR